MEVQPQAFIVGMSRSGTTWLSRSLNNHTKVSVFGETGFWGNQYIQTSQYWSEVECKRVLRSMLDDNDYINLCKEKVKAMKHNNKKHTQDNGSICEFDKGLLVEQIIIEIESMATPISPSRLFNILCGHVSRITGKPYIIEKTPHHVNWYKRIQSKYPNAKFVVMSREPYSFMRSYKYQGKRKKEKVRKNYERLYHPAGTSLVYRRYCKSVKSILQNKMTKTLHVKNKDITENPKDTIERVQSFLNVEVNRDICCKEKQNSSFPDGDKGKLTSGEIYWMRNISQEAYSDIGYTMNKNGSLLNALVYLLGLPKWTCWASYHIIKRQRVSSVYYIKKMLFG